MTTLQVFFCIKQQKSWSMTSCNVTTADVHITMLMLKQYIVQPYHEANWTMQITFSAFNILISYIVLTVGNPQHTVHSATVRLKTKHTNSNNPFTKPSQQRLYNKQWDIRM